MILKEETCVIHYLLSNIVFTKLDPRPIESKLLCPCVSLSVCLTHWIIGNYAQTARVLVINHNKNLGYNEVSKSQRT